MEHLEELVEERTAQIEEFVNKLIENVVTLELDAAYLQKSVESRSVL